MRRMDKGKNQISGGVVEQGSGSGSAKSLAFGAGDVIYVRLSSGSWWPAQVVEDETVDANVKPGNRGTEDVLVRLYGSYTYLYVDPLRSCSEFETMIKSNKGDLRKILEEALEKDLPSTKKKTRGRPSSKSASKRKSPAQGEGSSKGQKQNKDGDLGSRSCETASGKPQELSSRRIRVMESLGLIAPAGSPFLKHARYG